MARYVFNIRQHEHAMIDDDGEELSGLDEAEKRAIVAAREIMTVMTTKSIDASDGGIDIQNHARRAC